MKKLGALLIGILFSLLLIEISLRLVPSLMEYTDAGFYRGENWFSYHPISGYALKRNANFDYTYDYKPGEPKKVNIKTNSDGFREREFMSLNNKPVILAFGDSFTEAYHVESHQTWPARLEKELGGKYQVLNFGVHNYNLSQYLLLAEHYSRKINNVKAVIFGFYTLNDLKVYKPAKSLYRNRKLLQYFRSVLFFKKIKEAFSRPDSTSNPKETLDEKLKIRLDQCAPDSTRDEDHKNYFHGYINFHKYLTDTHYNPQNETFQQTINRTTELLNFANKKVSVPLYLTLIPMREQVSDLWWQRYQCLFGVSSENRTVIQDELKKKLQNLTVIDLQKPFSESSFKENLYLPFDGHWDVDGHKLAANILKTHIFKTNHE